LNFIYCFDTNYNSQAFTSMISLLDCVDKKIDIFIIHNDKNFEKKIPKQINKHKNLNSLHIYSFQETGYYFPNIPNTHVSEATYYRLFIENYLPKTLDKIIYLDADMVCLKNPIPYLNQELEKLEKSKYLVAARTEVLRREVDKRYVNNSDTPWVRLSVSEEYFNAGIMIINFKKWIEEGYTVEFIKKLKELKSKIIMWDQDVMNAVINGNYSKLSIFFNFKDNDLESRKDRDTYNFEDIIFYHFAGSGKPWKTNGAFRRSSDFYHSNYRKIHNSHFHIEHDNISNSVKKFYESVKNKSFHNLHNKFTYVYEFIKTLIIRIVKFKRKSK